MGFELLRPGLAWLVLLPPLAFLAGWAARRRSRAELARWVVARHLARFAPGVGAGRAWLRIALGASALLFLALAALGPVRGHTYRAVSRKGLDLVLCLDTSRSMLAQDLRPSRLERARREIVGLLDRLKGDRVALVAFSGDAREVAPLTRDRRTLESLLAFVTPEDNQLGGTSLAAAIEHALSLFDGRTGAHEAVVLLTDGEDLEGKGAALAEEASKRGIRVYVVGVGTEAGGKIPVVEQDGRPSFLRDPDGNEVVTKLERAGLEALARRTGGDYISAEESATPLEDLYRARIGRIQGREIESGERRVPYDRFQWPLALGLLCLVLEAALRGRSRSCETERESPRIAAAFLPLFLLGGGQGFDPERSLANAVRHVRAGELESAEQAARAILQEADALELAELERARVHYALGVITATRALEAEEEAGAQADWEAARAAFSAARALAGPGELRLDATYDLGAVELFQAEKKRAQIPEVAGQPAGNPLQALQAGPADGGPPADPLEEARELYQAAKAWFLERLRAEWQDEDTRANLELVQRRLHELDRIEKQREEEQQQQQQQQDQDEKDQQQDQQEEDQQEDQQGDRQQEPQEDQQQEEKEQEQGQDQQQPEPDEQEPGQEETQPQPEELQEAGQEQAKPEEDRQPAERILTREEVMQLLDKLAELEKQQKALEAALRARSRAKVKRDW